MTVHVASSLAIEPAWLGLIIRRFINGLLNAGGFKPINLGGASMVIWTTMVIWAGTEFWVGETCRNIFQ